MFYITSESNYLKRYTNMSSLFEVQIKKDMKKECNGKKTCNRYFMHNKDFNIPTTKITNASRHENSSQKFSIYLYSDWIVASSNVRYQSNRRGCWRSTAGRTRWHYCKARHWREATRYHGHHLTLAAHHLTQPTSCEAASIFNPPFFKTFKMVSATN